VRHPPCPMESDIPSPDPFRCGGAMARRPFAYSFHVHVRSYGQRGSWRPPSRTPISRAAPAAPRAGQTPPASTTFFLLPFTSPTWSVRRVFAPSGSVHGGDDAARSSRPRRSRLVILRASGHGSSRGGSEALSAAWKLPLGYKCFLAFVVTFVVYARSITRRSSAMAAAPLP